MNSAAKDIIVKLVDELPETKVGEVIDFIRFLNSKNEHELLFTPKEEEEIWNLLNTDDRISSDKVKELFRDDLNE